MQHLLRGRELPYLCFTMRLMRRFSLEIVMGFLALGHHVILLGARALRAATPVPGFWRRLLDGMIASRGRAADREIARHRHFIDAGRSSSSRPGWKESADALPF